MTCYLTAWRERQRFTVADAAERLGVSTEQYELAERGQEVLPATRASIERRFGRTLLELATGRAGRGPRRQVL